MSDGHTQAQHDLRVAAIRALAFEEMAKWPEDRLVAAHKQLLKNLGKDGAGDLDFLDMVYLLSLCSLLPTRFDWAMSLIRAYAAKNSEGAFSRMLEAEGSDIPRRMRKRARSVPPAPPSIAGDQ